MKYCDLIQVKARSAFKSLYPYLVRQFSFSDSEIDFFINHPIFNYRLYVCNCVCEVCLSFPSLFRDFDENYLFEFCFALLEGHFLPFSL